MSAVAFLIFLASLVAIILYRFIRVSQDEQRSNAEISAARSVQALLIPTQLPSTRNFMLESAYLPIHGVGGDFFQVLPLKDDSLLIVVGDVSGKGLQAAMNSSTLVGALRNELSHDPATVLSHLNHVLIGAVSAPGAVPELDAAPCFATCLCARIYPDGSLAIANAGHLSPYRDGRELELDAQSAPWRHRRCRVRRSLPSSLTAVTGSSSSLTALLKPPTPTASSSALSAPSRSATSPRAILPRLPSASARPMTSPSYLFTSPHAQRSAPVVRSRVRAEALSASR